jgi:uncharacterized membrane protein
MEEYSSDINRTALIVKLKKPFINWVVYTIKEYDWAEHEMKQKRSRLKVLIQSMFI